MKIKLIVGFRRDQEHSIDVDEAHKAYYLFLHPEERGIFNSGLAIKGDQIQEIVPDWQGTMGWNASHQLDGDDWNEVNSLGLQPKMQYMLCVAKLAAQEASLQELNAPLSQLIEEAKSLPPTSDTPQHVAGYLGTFKKTR
jgi:hypothetical protein